MKTRPEVGSKVLYCNRPCTVLHVYDNTADLRTEDGYRLLGKFIAEMQPYKSTANDSRRARLHRALDCVLDRSAAARDINAGFGWSAEWVAAEQKYYLYKGQQAIPVECTGDRMTCLKAAEKLAAKLKWSVLETV